MIFEIIRLTEDTFDKFHTLHKRVYRSHISYQHLYEKYFNSYVTETKGPWGCLAINSKSEAIGFCGNIPFEFNIDGETFFGAQTTDGMTRKDARGNGVFAKLNQASEQLSKESGIDFVFGFPNQDSAPILIKYAQWNTIDTMLAFTIPVATNPIKSIRRKIPIFKNAFRNQESELLKSYSKENGFLSRSTWNGIVRSEEYYRYKQFNNNIILELDNGVAWIKLKQLMYIGDIQLHKGKDLGMLLQELNNLCKSIGINKMVFLGSSKLKLTTDFSHLYQPIDGNVVGIKQLNLKKKIDFDLLRFTYGDYDSF